VTSRAELVLDEVLAQNTGDGNGPSRCFALGRDDALLRVPRALDPDHAARQVDVVPTEREELAAAQACIHRRRPEGAVTLR
jgi:hypothetical protein